MHHWFLAFSYKYTSKKDGKVKISSFTSRGQRSTLRSMTSMERSEVLKRQTTLLKSSNQYLLSFGSYGRFPVSEIFTSGPELRNRKRPTAEILTVRLGIQRLHMGKVSLTSVKGTDSELMSIFLSVAFHTF